MLTRFDIPFIMVWLMVSINWNAFSNALSLPDFERDNYVKYCDPDGGECLFGRCSGVKCLHGKCDDRGACSCHPCWIGNTCDSYVDGYRPRFLAAEPYYVIPPEITGDPLFRIEASDDDLGLTCPLGPGEASTCPCAVTSYAIIGGEDDDYFDIDEETGDVFWGRDIKPEPGRDYHIVLRVAGLEAGAYGNFTHNDYVDVVVHVEKRFPYLFPPVFLNTSANHEDNHHRHKRQTDDSIWQQAVFTLTQTTNKKQASIGEKLSYRLEILLPTVSDAATFVVEAFTVDPRTGTTASALCGVQIQSIGNGIKGSKDLKSILPIMYTNRFFATVFDRAVMDFGKISNSGDGKGDDSKMVVTFDAILVRANITNGKAYYVSAGAEYDSKNLVWVGQEMIQAKVENFKSGPYKFDIKGPDVIQQNDYGIISVTGGIGDPSVPVTVLAYNPDGVEDIYSVGSIGVRDLGINFLPCMPTMNAHYNNSHYVSESERTFPEGQLYIQLLNNIGGDPNHASPGNQLTFDVPIFVHDMAVEGTKFPVSVAVYVGDVPAPQWTGQVLIEVKGVNNPTGSADTNFNGTAMTKTTVPPGSAVTMEVNVIIEHGKWVNLFITATGTTSVSPCSARIVRKGWNVPYVIFKSTYERDNLNTTLKADYGTVANTGKAPSYDYVANTVMFEVSYSVSASAAEKTYDVSVSVGSKSFSEKITVQNSKDRGSANIKPITEVVTDFYYESEVGIKVVLDLPVIFLASQVQFQVTTDPNLKDIPVRICRANFRHIGNGVPCLKNKNLYSYKYSGMTASNPQRGIIDKSVLGEGDICTTGVRQHRRNPSRDRLIVYDTVFELLQPINQPYTGTDQYTLTAIVTSGDTTVTKETRQMKVTPSDVPKYTGSAKPIFISLGNVMSANSPGIKKGQISLARFLLKMPPGGRGKMMIKISVGANLKLCSVRLVQVGYNYPCVESIPNNQYTFIRGFKRNTRLQYTKPDVEALLDLGGLTNIESEDARKNEIWAGPAIIPVPVPDMDSLIVGAFVRVLDTSTGSSDTVSASLDFGGGTATADYTVKLVGTSLEKKTGDLKFSFIPMVDTTNNVYKNVPKILALNITFPDGFNEDDITIQFKNPDFQSKKYYKFCNAAVTLTGGNLPCVMGATIKTKYVNQIIDKFTTYEYVEMKFPVCYYKAFTDEVENMIQIEVAVQISDDFSGSDISVSPRVLIGTKEVGNVPSSVKLSVGGVFSPPPLTAKKLSVVPDGDFNNDGKTGDVKEMIVGEKAWLPFRINIPPTNIMQLQVSFTIPPGDNGRALVTLHDSRIPYIGNSISCIGNVSDYKVVLSATDLVKTPDQKNKYLIDFGYVMNTGMGSRQGSGDPNDDTFVIEVLAQMTDHPATMTSDMFVTATVTPNKADTVTGKQQLKRIVSKPRNSERADIIIDISVDGEKTMFEPGQIVQLKAIVKHSAISKGEASNLIVRIYKPKYMIYDAVTNTNSINITGSQFVQNKDKDFLTVKIPFLYFVNVAEIKFSLTMDSKAAGGILASGIQSATTVLQPLCTQIPIAGFPASADVILQCGPPGYVIYQAVGKDCYDPLGISSDSTQKIPDCAITASTAIDENFSPSKARLNGNGYWSPVVRMPMSKWQHFIQVDFGSVTRVTKIKLDIPTGNRNIKTAKILYSDLGIRFTAKEEAKFDVGVNEYTLKTPIQARFLRLQILEADGSDDVPIGIRMEWYGCPIEPRPQTPVCDKDTKTILSSSAPLWRHFVYDDTHEILYVCDKHPKKGLLCYSTRDDGTSWKALPRYLGHIIGYDTNTGKVIAQDSKKRSYLTCSDGEGFVLMKPDVAKNIISGTDFIKSTVVPGYQKTDKRFPIVSPPWQADFSGMIRVSDNNYKLQWDTCDV